MNDRFRILSLCGGGVRGLYTACFLAKIEQLLSKRFVDYFDLIVGTSTGGLIALAIGLNLDVATLRDFYKHEGHKLFPAGTWKRRLLLWKQLIYPKYDNIVLQRAIQDCLGTDRLLGNSIRPLVINAFHAATGSPVCFKTRHHPDFHFDHKKHAWEIAMATSAAPVFYRAFQAEGGADYIDGGVWANCPVLVGIIEGMHRFGRQRDRIDLLSVGTTRSTFQLSQRARVGGAWANISIKNRTAINLMMEANRASSMFMAEQLIGRDSIYQIDHVCSGDGYELDDARPATLRDLESLGEEDAKSNVQAVSERFFKYPARPWSPVPETL